MCWVIKANKLKASHPYQGMATLIKFRGLPKALKLLNLIEGNF
jgi:hypothetical protein